MFFLFCIFENCSILPKSIFKPLQIAFLSPQELEPAKWKEITEKNGTEVVKEEVKEEVQYRAFEQANRSIAAQAISICTIT